MTKIITIACVGIIAFAISITVTQIFTRKEKRKSEEDGKIKIAYSLLLVSWIIPITLLIFHLLFVLNEFIDLINRIENKSNYTEILNTSIIFIGLANVWLIIWNLISKVFTMIFTGRRIEVHEIENNNHAYFLIKGVVFIGFIYVLMPVFDMLLRLFLPEIEIPYYR
jgi:hypothetical protein